VLLHHSSALAAVAVAGFLVALAASSAPLVTTAAASAALKDQLTSLSPLATGLEITGFAGAARPLVALSKRADTREQAIDALGRKLGLEPGIFTTESQTLELHAPAGDIGGILMARTGVLDHIQILSQTSGPGVWLADQTAQEEHIRPGDTISIEYLGGFPGQGVSRKVRMRVKGIYKSLDRTTVGPYWAHFLLQIYPAGVDPPPPVRFVFMTRNELLGVAHSLTASQTIRTQGRVFHSVSGPLLSTTAELAVDPHGLTLARARVLNRRIARLRSELGGSNLGRTLGCHVQRSTGPTRIGERHSLCTVATSLSSAVLIADRNASEISPVVSLLSGAAVAIALAVAAAAGVFLVRRRAAEAALHYARGESVGVFGTRTGLELLLPVITGAALGFAVALGLTGVFAATGSVDPSTVHAAVRDAALAAAAALALAVIAAAAVYLRQFDSGTRAPRWLRFFPWELVLLAVALWLLHDIRSGGGLAHTTGATAGHPTLAVFVFPLLLVAAAAGLVARGLRLALRPRVGGGSSLPTAPFFALRRLAAARGLLTALLVVSAVAFGAYFYAQALASSLTASVAEKGYAAYGGDVQGLVTDSTPIPKHYPYPVTKLDYENQSATIGGPGGTDADVMAIDSATLGAVIRWYGAWGADPRPLFGSLPHVTGGRVPVIVTDDVPAGTRAVYVQGIRLPVRVVARVRAFPGMSAGIPLIVADHDAFLAAARKAGVYDPIGDATTYLWARGPTVAVSRAVQAAPIEAAYVTTIDSFRKNPDVVLAKRTFNYMRLIAVASGLLVFIGLLLYLQARQRSQAVASALAGRMGLSRRTEIASLALELGAIASIAALVGGIVAIAAAGPIVGHIDPLPDNPPAPSLAIPVAAIVAGAIGLVVVALAASVVTSWSSRRTDMGEALRVA
jgi:putative ABC transport system permease protein